MNAPLRISSPGGDQELEKKFVEEAAAQNMIQLKGHLRLFHSTSNACYIDYKSGCDQASLNST